MKLYHGTGERFARDILHEGLKPRGNRKGNWDHSVPSNKNAVYLSNAYAPYFSICAVENLRTEKLLVVEVETDRLNPWKLSPDEDALEQGNRMRPDSIPGPSLEWDMERRTKWFRRNLLSNYAGPEMADISLRLMGNCAYHGNIPIEAITNIIMIDGNLAPMTVLQFMDPSISIMNYQLVGDKYRGLTKWLFNRDIGKDAPKKVAEFGSSPFMSWVVPPDTEFDAIDVIYSEQEFSDGLRNYDRTG